MLQKLGYLLLSLAISFLVFFVILKHSERKSNLSNGFARKFTEPVVMIWNVSLKEGIYGIANVLNDTIILTKFDRPYDLVKFPFKTKSNSAKYSQISLLKNREGFGGNNTIEIFKNDAIILSGLSGMAYKFDFAGNTLLSSKIDSSFFYQTAIVNCNSYILAEKLVVENSNRRSLKKVTWSGKNTGNYLVPKYGDGYFSNDGFFKYDRVNNKLIYMFYYRGEFMCLDSNFKLSYTAKTIDTVRASKVYLKAVKNQLTYAVPPKVVNKRFVLHDGKIFIHSALRSDNQSLHDFKKSQLIDVYDINVGKYICSFILPRFENQKVLDFYIHDNHILTVYHKHLAVFSLPLLETKND